MTVGHQDHHGEDQDRDRHAQHALGAKAHLVRHGDVARLGDQQPQAAASRQGAEGRHERDDAQAGNEQRIQHAPQRSCQQTKRHNDGHRPALFQQDDDHCASDIHGGADRQVDAAGQQDEGHAHGDHAHERRREGDVRDIGQGKKARIQQAEQQEDDHEQDQRHVLQDRQQDTSVAAHMPDSRKAVRKIASLLNWVRSNAPWISP